MLMTTISAQGQWEIMNEGYTYDFSYVDFINKDTGWHAGAKGLFKTTDGAESWVLVYDDTTLHEIDFYNDTIGWAYVKSEFQSPDPDACIVKTLDGGHTWFCQKKVSPLRGLYVLSDSVVYSFEMKYLDEWRYFISKTVDGGTSWEDLPRNWESKLRLPYFYNADTFVVISDDNTIFRTFDGGQTWDRIESGFGRINSIKLINGSSGYFTASNETSSFICKTTDTFSSWSVITKNSEFINFCHFFNDDTIIALKSLDWGASRYIINSTDGGATWKQTDHMQLIANGWGYIIQKYVIENVAYLFAMSEGMSFILKSTDLGTHWKCLNLTFPMQDVHFMNRDNGFIAGSYRGFHHRGGFILKTQNAGRTWTPTYNPGFVPGKMHFLNDSLGFISDSWGGYVYATSDGGNSWIYNENLDIPDLHSLNDSVSWLMDRDYNNNYDMINILKTMDGGHLWDTILNFSIYDYDRNYYSLFLNDENTAYVVGEKGHIIKFSENGDWETIESGTSLPLNKVIFVDEKFGIITGGYSNEEDFRPIILITEDGGNYWTKGPDLPYWIHDLHFLDSQHGFAVGEDAERHGVLLETNDKGSSWIKVMLEKNLSGPLYALHFKNGVAWAVGENSLILKNVSSITSNQEYVIIKNESAFQNYPNPFHSNTTISYHLPETTDIELSIYDLSGRKIATLLNESQAAGRHELEWNAEVMQPGIYICELKTKQGKQVIKMILTK